MNNILTLLTGLLLGFVLPGTLLALIIKNRDFIISSFMASYLLIFHVVFWLGVCTLPISFRNVMILCGLISGIIFLIFVGRRSFHRVTPIQFPQTYPRKQWVFVVAIFLSIGLFTARSITQPLSGWDTAFRWNFLAAKLLQLKTFSFYPPVTPEHFEHYFYVDGIPPLCQFAYFWLYAPYGKVVPLFTSLLVVPQYLLSISLCYNIAKHLFSEAAGIFAATIFCATPLIFWAVFMGQETGLTTLSFLAITYFLLTTAHHDGTLIIAGFATALGALSREYGWTFWLYGLLICAQKRMSLKRMVWYSLTVFALAGPWYIRNWIVTGNPFYSHSLSNLFPVNTIHTELLAFYTEIFSFSTNWSFMLTNLVKYLTYYAILPTVTGLIGCFTFFKRASALVIGAGMLTAIWIYTVGQTAGGLLYSMRVLAPVFAILAVFGGAILQRLSHKHTGKIVIVMGLLLMSFASVLQNLVVPHLPWTIPVAQWIETGFSPQNPDSMFQELRPIFAPGERILSDHAYAHAALSSEDVSLIPIWSPEVRFTFDESLSPTQILQQLRQKNISYMLLSARANMFYLDTYPFYHFCFTRIAPIQFIPQVYALFSLESPEEPASGYEQPEN